MSKCANCGAALSCGCQKRVTPDGRQGCSKCISTMSSKPPTSTVQNKN